MSITSSYSFPFGFAGGFFTGVNTLQTADQPYSISVSGNNVTVHRPEAELIADLSSLICYAQNVALLHQIVDRTIEWTGASASLSLTSDLFVRGFPSGVGLHAPADSQRVGAGTPLRVTFWFTVEFALPWFCSNVSATIQIWAAFSLDSSGALGGQVTGFDYSSDGTGGPICYLPVKEGLPNVLNNLAGLAITEIIRPGVTSVAEMYAGTKKKQIYLLPGHGAWEQGSFSDNAIVATSLGIIPA